MQQNFFEQFNINYANEKLQQYFNRHIFSLEQLEYNREGINWADINWVDNSECLDLVERKLGLLSLMDEESRFPKGTDASLLSKLHTAHGLAHRAWCDEAHLLWQGPAHSTSARACRTPSSASSTTPATSCTRATASWRRIGIPSARLVAMRAAPARPNAPFQDLQACIQQGSDFVYELFDDLEQATGSRVSTARKKPTVSYQFKVCPSPHLLRREFVLRCWSVMLAKA